MTLPLFDTPVPTAEKKMHKLVQTCPICSKVAREKSSITTRDGVKITTLECYHIIRTEVPKDTPFQDCITFEHRLNGCTHDWNKNHCLKCDAYRGYNFQVEGAKFIESSLAVNKGAGLFDDPGLGKTITPLIYLNFHPKQFPFLVICKSRLKFQYFKAIIRWLGPSHAAQIIRTSKDPIVKGFKCYIVSYDILRRFDTRQFIDVGIKLIILDECQHVKNDKSKRTREVQDLVSDENIKVIPTSGTPWKNRGGEFFVSLNMIAPQKFPTKQGYLSRWVDYYASGSGYKEGGLVDVKAFRKFTEDCIIRRERKDVLPDLPIINRTLHYCELDSLEQSAYDATVSDFVEWYNDAVLSGEEDSFKATQHILAKFQMMRHITGLAKIPATFDFVLDHILDTQRSIVVFIHHVDVGDILYDKLSVEFGISKVFRLTGGMNADFTSAVVEAFNRAKPAVAIASTLAAGEGLDGLQETCSDCVLHERQWNPGNEEQAEGRLIRIGQESQSVNGTYITAAGTIDEHQSRIIERKRIDFHNSMNKGEPVEWQQNDIMGDLAATLVKESSRLKKMASF